MALYVMMKSLKDTQCNTGLQKQNINNFPEKKNISNIMYYEIFALVY